jgi:hypothetical protein
MRLNSLSGRHYVLTLDNPWWRRRFIVQRCDAFQKPVKGRLSVGFRYTTVSHHWTYRAAQRAAHRGDIRSGCAQ